MNSADKRIEETLNKGGQTISDLPKDYQDAAECMRAYAEAQKWRSENNLSTQYECEKYILHLTDVIDRLETALDNQVTLHEHLIHVIGNADIPEGVSYDQFCLVVDSIYKAVQTAQEGWENYEDGVPKDGSVDDENR